MDKRVIRCPVNIGGGDDPNASRIHFCSGIFPMVNDVIKTNRVPIKEGKCLSLYIGI